MDRLRAIRYFIKVAELGSFTAAATALGVPASSVSRRIQGLEDDLGTTLLHRTTRSVGLTELGALYLDSVKPAVKGLDDARELVVDRPASASGLLRISAIPGYGGRLLMPAIKKLRQKYPDLIVDLELTDQIVNLAANEVDIAVRSTATPPERSVAVKLTDNDFKLVATKAYLDRHGIPTLVSDLADHKTILHRGPSRAAYWQAKTDHGWVEVQSDPVFVSNVAEELVSEVLDGKGLALLPSWGIADALDNGVLVDVTPENSTMALTRDDSSSIYLLYNRPRYRLNKIKVTVDFLVAELAVRPNDKEKSRPPNTAAAV